jgi:hypothetical protein
VAHCAGKNQYLTFNLLNLTNSLASEVKATFNGQEIDVSTIGQSWQDYLQGQSGLSLSVSGVFDSGTATTNLDSVMYANMNGGGTKLYEYCPAGSASNAILYKGNGFLSAYEVGGAVGDKVGFSATIRCSGTPVRSTIT